MWHNRTPGSFVSGLNDEELERVRRAFVELADPASGLLQGNQVGLLMARLELDGPPPAPPWRRSTRSFDVMEDGRNVELTFAMQSHQFAGCRLWPYHVEMHDAAVYQKPFEDALAELGLNKESLLVRAAYANACAWQRYDVKLSIINFVPEQHGSTAEAFEKVKVMFQTMIETGRVDPPHMTDLLETPLTYAAIRMQYAQSYGARIEELRKNEDQFETMLQEVEVFVKQFEQVMEADGACWVYYDLKVDNIGWDGQRIVLFDLGSFATVPTPWRSRKAASAADGRLRAEALLPGGIVPVTRRLKKKLILIIYLFDQISSA